MPLSLPATHRRFFFEDTKRPPSQGWILGLLFEDGFSAVSRPNGGRRETVVVRSGGRGPRRPRAFCEEENDGAGA